MRIAICDGDVSCLEQTRRAAASCVGSAVTIDPFSHPEQLLEAAEKSGGYDLYILETLLPGMNGISLGGRLRESGCGGRIIYLTTTPDYALDAFRVRAFDYLLKPLCAHTFARTLDEAIGKKTAPGLPVRSGDSILKLEFDAIVCAERNRRTVSYHLPNGQVVESNTLRGSFSAAIAPLLADKRFALCGASMVVNLDHITEMGHGTVVFGNTHRVFLGEKHYRKLRQAWMAWQANP